MSEQRTGLKVSAAQNITCRMSVYPSVLRERLGKSAPENLFVVGNYENLQQPMIALICSVRCPGGVIIHTFDAIRALRDANITVIGGFHSPMEQECLDFLLRGKQPVILSPAKGLGRPRYSATVREGIDKGRITVVSMFPPTTTRTNKQHSYLRNDFIAALATAVLVAHASPAGNAETIARRAIQRQQPLFSINVPQNEDLFQLGARPFNLEEIKKQLNELQ